MRLLLRLNIACHNAHNLKIYNRQQLKMVYVYIFVKQTLCFCIETIRNFVNQNKIEYNSYNLPMGRMSLVMG